MRSETQPRKARTASSACILRLGIFVIAFLNFELATNTVQVAS